MTTKEKKFYLEAAIEIPKYETEYQNVKVSGKTKEEALASYKKELEDGGRRTIFVENRASPIPGIVFLAITLFLSLFDYYAPFGYSVYSLFPNAISILISIGIYIAFVIRVKGIENTFNDALNVIISLLFIMVLAVFIKIFMRDISDMHGILGSLLTALKLNNSYMLLGIALVLSWVGMKQVSGIIWILIIALGLGELISAGDFMGNYLAIIFLLSAFVGVVFYLKYEGRVIINSFKKGIKTSSNFIASDLNATKNLTQKEVGETQKIISSKIEKKKIEQTTKSGKEELKDEK